MPNLLARLLPREGSFFILFKEVTENLKEAAVALSELAANYTDVEVKVQKIKALEHRGDDMTHRLAIKLSQTFITPFDREDIHQLFSKLDDVLDLMDSVTTRLVLYKIDKLRPGFAELADILVRATQQIHEAVSSLETHKGVLDRCIEINRLENEADTVVRSAIVKLFDEEKDPIMVIKWKEILEVLEIANDKCEDVANVLENVVLKNS